MQLFWALVVRRSTQWLLGNLPPGRHAGPNWCPLWISRLPWGCLTQTAISARYLLQWSQRIGQSQVWGGGLHRYWQGPQGHWCQWHGGLYNSIWGLFNRFRLGSGGLCMPWVWWGRHGGGSDSSSSRAIQVFSMLSPIHEMATNWLAIVGLLRSLVRCLLVNLDNDESTVFTLGLAVNRISKTHDGAWGFGKDWGKGEPAGRLNVESSGHGCRLQPNSVARVSTPVVRVFYICCMHW
jgi:hypothetical protein